MGRSVIIIVVCFLMQMSGCVGGTSQSCISIPQTSSEAQKKAATDLAVKLEALKVSADLKTEFTSLVKSEFASLSDSNMSLFLFLQAIDCYSNQETPIGAELARTMALIVKARWASENKLAGASPVLTKIEKSLIDPSPFSSEIYAEFKKFGIQ